MNKIEAELRIRKHNRKSDRRLVLERKETIREKVHLMTDTSQGSKYEATTAGSSVNSRVTPGGSGMKLIQKNQKTQKAQDICMI